jgi:hypothetical protein
MYRASCECMNVMSEYPMYPKTILYDLSDSEYSRVYSSLSQKLFLNMFWTSFDDKVTGYLLTMQPFCHMAYSAYFEV